MEGLPPLTALRAFEAVGRNGVAGASRELNVTRAAVLHQIRVLEADLGVELFVRSNRGLSLSMAGQAYLRQVMRAFGELSENSRRLKHSDPSRRLVVSSLVSFALDFIAPRIDRFYDLHPDIPIDIMTQVQRHEPIDFTTTGANVSIQAGVMETDWSGVTVEKLAHEIQFPVCAPQLVEGPNGLRRPEDLANVRLLEATYAPEGWRNWIAAASAAGYDMSAVNLDNTKRFDLLSLSMAAATSGAGVDIGRSPSVDHYLATGQLVAPFGLEIVSKRAYWLVCLDSVADSPEFQAFRNWLMDELLALGRPFKTGPEDAN